MPVCGGGTGSRAIHVLNLRDQFLKKGLTDFTLSGLFERGTGERLAATLVRADV